jgi:hypothetical protein
VLVSTQVSVPVEQEPTPRTQGLGLVLQELPGEHPPQPPPLQTWFVPQEVPLGSAVVVSTQVTVPVAQEVTPCTQRFGLVLHEVPAVQLVHAPPLHTWLVPQGVPLVTGVEVSTQLALPLAQETVPWAQTKGLVLQEPPAVQATQAPLELQTRFVPQEVPGVRGLAVSAQPGTPPAQVLVPCRQAVGLVEQGSPTGHETHAPEGSHRPPSQGVPASAVRGEVQVAPEVPQATLPVRQVPATQESPAVQSTQAPLAEHTPPSHAVPAGTRPLPETQVGTPPVQERVPW